MTQKYSSTWRKNIRGYLFFPFAISKIFKSQLLVYNALHAILVYMVNTTAYNFFIRIDIRISIHFCFLIIIIHLDKWYHLKCLFNVWQLFFFQRRILCVFRYSFPTTSCSSRMDEKAISLWLLLHGYAHIICSTNFWRMGRVSWSSCHIYCIVISRSIQSTLIMECTILFNWIILAYYKIQWLLHMLTKDHCHGTELKCQSFTLSSSLCFPSFSSTYSLPWSLLPSMSWEKLSFKMIWIKIR